MSSDGSIDKAKGSTKKARRQALETKAIRQRCPDCGALAGSPCESLTSGAVAATMHKRRLRLASYLPVPR